MDRNQKSDQSTSSTSRHSMWNLRKGDKEETFESMVSTSSQATATADCQDSFPKRRTASENWQLLRKLSQRRARIPVGEPSNQMALKANPSSATSLPELTELSSRERALTHWRRICKGINKQEQGAQGKEKPSKHSHESLEDKRSNELGSKRFPTTSPGSMASKLVADLILESFSLPPQQLCVVREDAPKFAQGFRVDPVELEVPQNSPVVELDSNSPQQQLSVRSDLFRVLAIAPTSSSFSETRRRGTSPIKRRSTTGQVATGTQSGSPTTTATKGKKCSKTSSGSTGSEFPNLRQRQQELHRYRVLVEQRRLDLLELKIAREREEALHSTILFHKKLQIKDCKIKAFEDNDCSSV